MKTGLVLSGGGARGAYEIGALKKPMADEGRDYDAIYGASVGGLTAAGLSQTPLGKPAEAIKWLEDLWLGLSTKDIYVKWPLWPASVALKKSVYDSSPLAHLVRSKFSLAKARASGKTVKVRAVNWETKEVRDVSQEDDDFIDWVLASASYPVMLLPVEINGEEWTDGGARDITPITAALLDGCKRIDVITTDDPNLPSHRWDPKCQTAITGYLPRLLTITFDEVMRNDLRNVGINNPFVRLVDEYADVEFRVLQPTKRMNGFDSLDFSPENIRKMIDIGYKEAYEENF